MAASREEYEEMQRKEAEDQKEPSWFQEALQRNAPRFDLSPPDQGVPSSTIAPLSETLQAEADSTTTRNATTVLTSDASALEDRRAPLEIVSLRQRHKAATSPTKAFKEES